MSTLRERCKALLEEMITMSIDDDNDDIDNLMAFVLAEKGRSADRRLEESLPLVLYCEDDAFRDELIAAFKAVRPNIVTKKMP